MTIVSLSPAPFFSFYLFVSHFVGFSCLSWIYVVHFLFLGFYVGFSSCLGPTRVDHIAISLRLSFAVCVHGPLGTSDILTSGVTSYFPSPFPYSLILFLPSLPRCNAFASSSHASVLPSKPAIILISCVLVLLITVCIAFTSRPRRPPLPFCLIFTSVPCTHLCLQRNPRSVYFRSRCLTNDQPNHITHFTDLKDQNIGRNQPCHGLDDIERPELSERPESKRG